MESNKKSKSKRSKAEKVTRQDLVDCLKMWRACNGSSEWARRMRSDMENQAYDRTRELLVRLGK